MALRINVNLYPKDGYFFRDSDGTPIRAGNWRAVIKKVIEYRERAGRPVGDVESEVIAQACQRNPQICRETIRVNIANRPVSLKSTVLQWLTGVKKIKERDGKVATVPLAEEKIRADVCAKCPLNTPLGVNSCSSCKRTLIEFRKFIFGDGRADGRLGGCSVLGVDLPTAARLDEIRVDNPQLPAHCWRKKIL